MTKAQIKAMQAGRKVHLRMEDGTLRCGQARTAGIRNTDDGEGVTCPACQGEGKAKAKGQAQPKGKVQPKGKAKATPKATPTAVITPKTPKAPVQATPTISVTFAGPLADIRALLGQLPTG